MTRPGRQQYSKSAAQARRLADKVDGCICRGAVLPVAEREEKGSQV
jgi:hypothetical protein